MSMNETLKLYFGVIKDERCQCDVNTITRIFAMLDPQWLSLSVGGILKALIKTPHEQIMIDGKAI